MDLEELLEGAAACRRAVVERLRRFGLGGGARRAPAAPEADAALADVHREHVATLLEASLVTRVEGRPTPPELELDALARLGPAVERWGLAAEVALLTAPAGEETHHRLAEALLRIAPTPERRRLCARLGVLLPRPRAEDG